MSWPSDGVDQDTSVAVPGTGRGQLLSVNRASRLSDRQAVTRFVETPPSFNAKSLFTISLRAT